MAAPTETPYVREPGYAQRYRDQRFATGSGPRTDARERRAIVRLLEIARLAELARPEAAARLPQHPRADLVSVRGATRSALPWLDMPSGAGRLTALLSGGPAAVRVDRDPGMLAACGGQHPRVCASAQALPFRAQSFAGVLCMRLFQHIPVATERVAILSELRRVTRGPVVLSFFDALSLQHLRRRVSAVLGKRSARVALTRSAFARELARAGLRIRADLPLLRFVSEQRLLLVEPAG